MTSINDIKTLLENRKNRLMADKSFAYSAGDIQTLISIEKELEDIDDSLKKLE